jgi:release factor H-coupled RctB family protein
LVELGLDPKMIQLVAHSGSRGLGAAILRQHTDRSAAASLMAASDEGRDYLAQHDRAMAWAKVNRELIVTRALQAFGCGARCARHLSQQRGPVSSVGA